MQLFLNFYNYSIGIECLEEEIIKKLYKEFFYFSTSSTTHPNYTVEISFNGPPTLPKLVAKKILETSIVYETNKEKFVQYSDTLVVQDKIANKAIIYTKNHVEAYEISFLLIHSLLGKNLDLKGIHRIHAVGINYNSQNALIMLPSKGGKSTLLSYLLENQNVKIISDDMPILDREGHVHSFPSKISVQNIPQEGFLSQLEWQKFERTVYPPKYTASLAKLQDRIAKNNEKHPLFLIAGFRTTSKEGHLEEVSKIKMILPLMEHMIFGFGLPQVLEYFLSHSVKDYFYLPYIALKRSLSAYKMLKHAKTFYLYLGTDKENNSKKVLKLLNENT